MIHDSNRRRALSAYPARIPNAKVEALRAAIVAARHAARYPATAQDVADNAAIREALEGEFPRHDSRYREVPAVAEVQGLEIRISAVPDYNYCAADDSPIAWCDGPGASVDRGNESEFWPGRALRRAVDRSLRKGGGKPYHGVIPLYRARHGHRPDRDCYRAADVAPELVSNLRDARTRGMARHAAWEFAKASALVSYDTLEAMNGDDCAVYQITAAVYWRGTAIAEDSIGGCTVLTRTRAEETSAREYLRDTAQGVALEALYRARQWLAESREALCECSGAEVQP